MIKALYIQQGKEYSVIRELSKILNKEGIEFVLTAKDERLLAQYRKDGFESHLMADLYSENHTFSEKELLNLDLKYGPPGIKEICNSDTYLRFIYNKQEEREQLVARSYKFWESFFAKNKIDYILFFITTAFFDTRTAYNVAKYLGKPSFGKLYPGPGKEYFTICDIGEEFCWSEFLNAFKNGPEPLTGEQRSFVFDYIKRHIKKNEEAVTIKFIEKGLVSSFREWIGLQKSIIDAKLHKFPYTIGVSRFASYKLLKRLWWKYFTWNLFSYDSPANERFLYMPFFSEDETMNVANFHYWTENQLPLIREVAENLPAGIKLYAKEHPDQPGEFSFKRLKKIQSIPNIKVINPLTRVQELLDNCEAVIVMDGLSGWEAYLRKKPVIMLAPKIYFSRSRLIYKVASPSELPVTLFNAIQRGSSIYSENEEEWLWFVHCVITTCCKGKFLASTYNEYNQDDLEKMAEGIARKIKTSI
jgi:hypothetical protein